MSTNGSSGGAGKPSPNPDNAFRLGPRVFVGAALALLLLVGVGGWAVSAQLSGAVIAQGFVTVDQDLKSIQHRDGGIVSEIAIREGDIVRAGDVLLRLQDTQTKAELSIVRSKLVELAIRRARLLAERDGLAAIEFPSDLNVEDSPDVFLGETRMFDGNRTSRESKKQQLELSVEQIKEEIKGLDAQRRSKGEEFQLVEAEYEANKGLVSKGIIARTLLVPLARDRVKLSGERGEIHASIARAKTRMSEIRVQIIAIDENARTEAQRELSSVEAEFSELRDRHIAIEDRLARTDIRAPISGTVNELNVHTIGGVITPAEELVTIVPEDAKLKVEVKLVPISIDQLWVGQAVRLRFTAFNQRTTPELKGELIYVSAATTRDDTTGESYYLGDVNVPAQELQKLGNVTLLPGMPVEVFITTEERTAMTYFIKPVTDQFSRAFREE
ncbi:HlyD family type I secretion periplasmic adaptor subunit [Halopseudomonas pelagia]|uniref:Membrane fusion protein (MFP) family protein n=1 Tax=Halopseudomonas pelagia TaxID=553151 RepID=A0AA91Z4H3_9GAMM|nr:HlyD family type I secretion periplasmic adaptor subunit [Halopseudomonas pelagia]PCC97803.1 hemolysin secretion protein D [Halopseudomonas pelagia]QFY57349.1 HlyD family type I secretion periplasmic adaptor subunit [Halopseudomonas pelagia]